MESIIIAVIVALTGSGGVFAFYKARLDHLSGKANREEDADERIMNRLEGQLKKLQEDFEAERRYTNKLLNSLSQAGIAIPERK